MDVTKLKAVSFDCYGTLIDWESGISAVLTAWARAVGLACTDEELLVAYAANEVEVEREQPHALYPRILAAAFRATGETLGREVHDHWAERLARSVPEWPAFPDSADALAILAEHYELIILSNVHRAGFAASNLHLRARFAAIITAEDVGAYKPADNHFEALKDKLAELNIAPDELLHVAQSLFHDHVPAKRAGLSSVWINRRHDRTGWGATPEPSEAFDYDSEFPAMADFAAAVSRAFPRKPGATPLSGRNGPG